jgi:glycosyltransferase involved in cell wall biosynthesis/peptidoglycan/xylan/chitin deacetylase (PgdA/CDA1 family)
MPELSVIIPTYNRLAVLRRTLPTVLAQTLDGCDHEVVVVVDGSTDGTVTFLKSLGDPSLKIVEQPNRGPAAARNSGLRNASGRLVLMLDDDFLCETGLLQAHSDRHRSGSRNLIVFGPILPAGAGLAAGSSAAESAGDLSLVAELADRASASTNDKWAAERALSEAQSFLPVAVPNFSAARQFILDAGGYDESFTATEDDELGLRLRDRGANFEYCSAAVVRHLNEKSISGFLRDAARDGHCDLLLCRKHPQVRPYSSLGLIAEGRWSRRAASHLLWRSGFLGDLLLQAVARAANRARSRPMVRRAGVAALNHLWFAREVRGAARELGGMKALERQFGRRLPVLLYHHVGPAETAPDPSISVSPAAFERHLRWLRRAGFNSITPQQWLGWRKHARPLPPRPIIITLDDGYADLATFAFPLLEKYGFSAVTFIVTSQLGGSNEWDRPLGVRCVRLLDADDLRLWSRRGITFGSHTHTHPRLTSLTDAALADELSMSRETLQGVLGAETDCFAYPFGDTDERVRRAAANHYSIAFGTDEGMNSLRTDPHHLNRIEPGDLMPFELPIRAMLGYAPFRQLRARLRLRERFSRTVGRPALSGAARE